jgi:hypothetical protein
VLQEVDDESSPFGLDLYASPEKPHNPHADIISVWSWSGGRANQFSGGKWPSRDQMTHWPFGQLLRTANALTELFRSVYVIAKWPCNPLFGNCLKSRVCGMFG